MLMCSMLECREYIHRIEYRTEWSCANEKSLWAALVSRACKSHHFTPISLASISRESDHAKLESAISCAREGGEIEFILYSQHSGISLCIPLALLSFRISYISKSRRTCRSQTDAFVVQDVNRRTVSTFGALLHFQFHSCEEIVYYSMHFSTSFIQNILFPEVTEDLQKSNRCFHCAKRESKY